MTFRKSDTPLAIGDYDDFVHTKHGWCYYSLVPGEPAYVYNLYVEPSSRRQGRGRQLLEAAIRAIRQSNYLDDIHVEAQPTEASIERDVLVAWYRNMGLVVDP